MTKLRILAGLLALLAVGAVVFVRASNASDSSAPSPAAAPDNSSCDSCCGPVVPEPIKTAVPAGQASPYSAEPAKDAAPAAVPAKN